MLGVREIKDPASWDAALLQLPDPHVLQTWAWGESKVQTGWRARRLLWSENGRPVAAAGLLVRRLRLGGAGLPLAVAYVPKGPALDWADEGLREAVLQSLEREARRAGAIFLKIDPDVGPSTPPGEALLSALRRHGWRASNQQIQFRNTVVNDLSPSEERLLAAMKPKWRYNIRLAEKRGVCLRPGSPADLPLFYTMYVETGRRDHFLVRPYAYYRQVWEPFMAQGLAQLLLAEVEGAPVAGVVLFRFGPTAWYFYGASTAQSRPLMPNYALQWAAMRWAKAVGCARYNWWGAPDVLAETDPMWGVFRFKAGFGGEFVQSIGAYDYPARRMLYWLYCVGMPQLSEAARRRHRVTPPARMGAEEPSG